MAKTGCAAGQGTTGSARTARTNGPGGAPTATQSGARAQRLRRFVALIVGLFLFALALVLSYQSNLGANSWMVFHDGIARQTPLTVGQAGQLVGLLMIALSWPIGIRPGLGTVLNMILVGLFTDLILWVGVIPLPDPYPARVGMLLLSVVTIGVASAMYIKAGFGAGPRDSFNLALTEVTGLSVGVTRWLIEATVVIFGILLGGRFGIGTILFAFLVGPAVGIGFRLFGLQTGRGGAGRETSEMDSNAAVRP